MTWIYFTIINNEKNFQTAHIHVRSIQSFRNSSLARMVHRPIMWRHQMERLNNQCAYSKRRQTNCLKQCHITRFYGKFHKTNRYGYTDKSGLYPVAPFTNMV